MKRLISQRTALCVVLPLISGRLVAADKFPVWHSEKTFARDCVGRETEKLFVLTFDDGPWHQTEPILDILAEEGVPATFFIIGSNFHAFPAYENLPRRMVREGHIAANHGMDNDEFDLTDVKDCQAEVSRVINGYDMKYFRPAQGAYTKAKYEQLVATGYHMIMWNLDPTDWRSDRNPNDILALVRDAVMEPTAPAAQDDPANAELPRRGSYIMLAHDNHDKMTQLVDGGRTLLAAIIDTIRGAGYSIVSLDECLGLSSTTVDLSKLDDIQDTNIVTHHTTNYCGVSWADASSCTQSTCPGGIDAECPSGMKCFTGMNCGGKLSFCGATWGDASTCSHDTCLGGIDAECPPGMKCFARVQCKEGRLDSKETQGKGYNGGAQSESENESDNEEQGDYSLTDIMAWADEDESSSYSLVHCTGLVSFTLAAICTFAISIF